MKAHDAVRAYKGFYLRRLGDVSLRKQYELKFTRGVRGNTGKRTKNLLGRGNSICKGLVEKWNWCLPRTKKSQSSSNKEAWHFMRKAHRARACGAWCALFKGNGKPLKDFQQGVTWPSLPFENHSGSTVDSGLEQGPCGCEGTIEGGCGAQK